MSDPNIYRSANIDSLRWDGAEVTPDDENDLPRAPAVIQSATDGTVRVTTAGGTVLDFYLNAGIPLQIFVDRVHDTGTDATGIVAMYGV